MGWRGAALWCRNTPGGATDLTRESECSKAGIRYWKIDIGDPSFHLIHTRNDAHIPLTLEHVHREPPVNGDWKRDGRFGPQPWNSWRIEILRHTDVCRTYDVTSILSLPTTLDRVGELMRSAAGHGEIHNLLNVEDEVYLAAVLGCTMGVMRHPLHGLIPGDDADLFFTDPARPNSEWMWWFVRCVGSGLLRPSPAALPPSKPQRRFSLAAGNLPLARLGKVN